jgi:hypothetical protein
MKKVIVMFAIAALTACGGASTEATTDSTVATVDSAAVVADTTVKGGGVAEELSTEGKAEQTTVENIK